MSMVSLPGLAEMIDNISQERNLPKPAVQAALREALLKGYERYRRTQRLAKASGGDNNEAQFDDDYFENFEVELDVEEEGFRVLATKAIVESVSISDREISLNEVLEVAAEAQLGDTVVLDVTPERDDFGRMAAIQTKQVLAQKLRDQQRKLIQEEFLDLEGEILQARVLRFERHSVIVAVSSGFGRQEVEAELSKREQLPNDNYRANATFKVLLKRVCDGPHRGPQLQVSRADAGLVVYLFENEVPEIEDEIVRIVAVAREANPPGRYVGPRTKIAVDTLERDVDPVGACIGARGSRIQVVVNELRGEKIDVIRWSPDPATYIANALSPARVDEVRLVDAEARQAHVLVPDNQLSLAIGKEGQNVRLAARLTGWKIDIKDTAKYLADLEQQQQAQPEISAEEADAVLETLNPTPEASDTAVSPLPEETSLEEELPRPPVSDEAVSDEVDPAIEQDDLDPNDLDPNDLDPNNLDPNNLDSNNLDPNEDVDDDLPLDSEPAPELEENPDEDPITETATVETSEKFKTSEG